MADRIDKVLVTLGLVSTRSQALQLVKEGVVFYQGKQVTKPSMKVEDEGLEVRKDVLYVGRGAHKIEGAISEFNVDPTGKVVADVGASTGGFTDYVLKNGASKVFAIDVGHDQLAKSLSEDERVVNMEGTNVRHPIEELSETVDLAVVDLSFISLKLTIDSIFSMVKNGGEILALVKPQFEVGKDHLGKNGIVKDANARLNVLKDLYEFCGEKKYFIQNAMVSPITGTSGNIEYFFYFKKGSPAHAITAEQLVVL